MIHDSGSPELMTNWIAYVTQKAELLYGTGILPVEVLFSVETE